MKLSSVIRQHARENDSIGNDSWNVESNSQGNVSYLSRQAQTPSYEDPILLEDGNPIQEQLSNRRYNEPHSQLQEQSSEEDSLRQMYNSGQRSSTFYSQNLNILSEGDSHRNLSITSIHTTSVLPVTSQIQNTSNTSYASETMTSLASSNERIPPYATSPQDVIDPQTVVSSQPRDYTSLEYVTQPPPYEPIVDRYAPPPTYEEATGLRDESPCSPPRQTYHSSEQQPRTQRTPVSDRRTNYSLNEYLEVFFPMCFCCIICCVCANDSLE